jgi:hypothetical protein
LWDVGILCSRAVIQRTIDVSPAFLEHGSVEKISVLAHANRHPNKQEVLHEVAQNSYQIFKIKNKKIKNL